MDLISSISPEHFQETLLTRLQQTQTFDAAVLRIGEADYGCEDRPDDAPQQVWLQLLLRDGSLVSLEVPETLLQVLELEEGSQCHRSDFQN